MEAERQRRRRHIRRRKFVYRYGGVVVESRLTDVQYPASASLNVHLHYDTYGRGDSVSDGTGSRATTFDDKGSPLTLTTTYTGLPAQGISYTYYPDGSLQTLGTPAGNFTYTFDGVGRPVGLSNPFSETFAWTYLDNGWLWTQRSGNALNTVYTYNALGQVTDLANRKLDNTCSANSAAWRMTAREIALRRLQPSAAFLPTADRRRINTMSKTN